ncbi:hypothetical protein L5876_05445 [Hyphobacterium sp. SN044]|uniref:hypothetical protein n=1 Tax=Hyphobacterium sp. SN044 TaxID=2912575 RepID=UPI001F1E9792|nr:hypothetical protein [Hyphobacterium sp. SN044]MCF8879254.1 hypothetical protein [Hyphobacterium sp. SN044]
MAGKKGRGKRTPEIWDALYRRHITGESVEAIAADTGLTAQWVRVKLNRMKRAAGEAAPKGYIDPVNRALARAETALDEGRHDDAMRDIRAAAAISRLRKETGMVTATKRPAGKAGGQKGLTLEEARRILKDRMAKERRARGSGGEREGD